MSKEEFRQRLMSLQNETHELVMANEVSSESALYGFLSSAKMSMLYAVMHVDEFKEIKDDDKDDE